MTKKLKQCLGAICANIKKNTLHMKKVPVVQPNEKFTYKHFHGTCDRSTNH